MKGKIRFGVTLKESFLMMLGKQQTAHRTRLPQTSKHGEPERSWGDDLVGKHRSGSLKKVHAILGAFRLGQETKDDLPRKTRAIKAPGP